MKILITGFEPFGGEKINPAWEAVNSLPSKCDFLLIKRKITHGVRTNTDSQSRQLIFSQGLVSKVRATKHSLFSIGQFHHARLPFR